MVGAWEYSGSEAVNSLGALTWVVEGCGVPARLALWLADLGPGADQAIRAEFTDRVDPIGGPDGPLVEVAFASAGGVSASAEPLVYAAIDEHWLRNIARLSGRPGSPGALTPEDFEPYAASARALTPRLVDLREMLLAHGRAAAVALVAAMRPYIAVETGACLPLLEAKGREGRGLLLAYREASAVLAIGPGVRDRLTALGLTDVIVPPLPTFPGLPPLRKAERDAIRADLGAGRLFCSIREQDWRIHHTDSLLRAFARHALGEHYGTNPILVLPAEGRDQDKTERLAHTLGLKNHILLVAPEERDRLWRLARAADLVIDSLADGCSGGSLLPAAAFGVPALGNFNSAALRREHPGLPDSYCAPSENALEVELGRRLATPLSAEAQARMALWAWSRLAAGIGLVDLRPFAAALAAAQVRGSPGIDSLRMKRLELPYEAASVDVYDAKYHHGAAYQMMDRKLVDIVAEELARTGLTHPRVLDLGCGPGSLVNELRRIPGICLTGVDLCPEMIEAARERYPDIPFEVDDAEALSFADASFDLVLCSGVLHHLPTLDRCLAEIRRVLTPDGILVAREPNEDNFSRRQPELAFAHLCMRHYLFHARGLAPVVEPEAHEYHHAFTYGPFVEELGRRMRVTRFHTDLMVSYFYDEGLTETHYIDPLSRLDGTLGNQPGLNVIAVARCGPPPGVDPQAAAVVERLHSAAPVAPEHFDQLGRVAGRLFEEFPAPFAGSPSVPEQVLATWFPYLRKPAARVLLAAHDGAGFRHLESWAKDRGLPTGVRTEPGRVIPPMRRTYDVGLIRLTRDVRGQDLVDLLECVRDYGLAVVEFTCGARVLGLTPRQREVLAILPILSRDESNPACTLRVCTSRYQYTPTDFYMALKVALERELARSPWEARELLLDLIDRASEQLNARADCFSSLVALFTHQRHLAGELERCGITVPLIAPVVGLPTLAAAG